GPRLAIGLFIHEAQHEHLSAGGILHDGGQQSVQFRKIELHLNPPRINFKPLKLVIPRGKATRNLLSLAFSGNSRFLATLGMTETWVLRRQLPVRAHRFDFLCALTARLKTKNPLRSTEPAGG